MYYDTEPCPVCGCHTHGLSNKFLCPACDAVWTSGEPDSIVFIGPRTLLNGFPLRRHHIGTDRLK
ncbi:hypothetical protein GCM10009837_42270 [Streptomyces durmitorensis]